MNVEATVNNWRIKFSERSPAAIESGLLERPVSGLMRGLSAVLADRLPTLIAQWL
jgi:hypothetical protein